MSAHDERTHMVRQRMRSGRGSMASSPSLIWQPPLPNMAGVIVFIFLSSFSMAFASCDVPPGSALATALERLDALATAAFLMELLIKARPRSAHPTPACPQPPHLPILQTWRHPP